jgi:hypothetical protein
MTVQYTHTDTTRNRLENDAFITNNSIKSLMTRKMGRKYKVQ